MTGEKEEEIAVFEDDMENTEEQDHKEDKDENEDNGIDSTKLDGTIIFNQNEKESN